MQSENDLKMIDNLINKRIFKFVNTLLPTKVYLIYLV